MRAHKTPRGIRRSALPANLVPHVRPPLEQLADSNLVGIVFSRTDGTIVDANDSFLHMVGYSRAELERGLRWMDLTPPEWMEASERAAMQVQASGAARTFQKEYVRKDGSRVPVLVGITMLSRTPAARIHRVAFVVDMTERKRAEGDRDRLTIERVAMLDSVGDGIYGLDKQGCCTFINRAAVDMLGYEPMHCLGRSMHQLIHSKRADGSPYPIESCPFYRVFEMGFGNRSDQEVLWRRDGTSFPIEGSAFPITANGRTEGVVVSFKDISGRLQAEAALRASEERFRSAFRNAAAGIFMTDLDGQILEVNRAFSEMTGYAETELVGIQHQGIAHPSDVRRDAGILQRMLRQEIPGFVGLERFVRKDSTLLWARLSVSVARNSAGEPCEIVCIVEDNTDRLRAETELRRSEARYRSIVENTPEGICMCDVERNITYCNDRLITMLGYETLGELQCSEIHFDEDLENTRHQFERQKLGLSESHETRLRRKDGSALAVSSSASPICDEHGNFGGAVCMFTDIEERKRLEDQLRQSQKMEAIGRLAGGIAHDFNNLLTVILGYGAVLERKLSRHDPLLPDVIEIRKAGERAAALTQKLLAFSRKQVLRPQVLSLNHLIRDTEAMLRRLIGEDIQLITELDPAACNVKADPGQLEQVLMNLVINARDAMPKGGRLLIETRRRQWTVGAAELRSLRPGAYVALTVTDTGCGMDEQTKARIFEPFFTTKEPGIGTGLGLATVLGIVKQSGGSIGIYSEVAIGTTFKIYLPLAEDSAPGMEPVAPATPPSKRARNILLVEDDPSIRALAAAVLREQGCSIVEAASAEEALRCDQQSSHFDLLLTDVVMSGMDGHELANQLVAAHPGLKVLYMSGYSERGVVQQGLLDPGRHFLPKPFQPQELLSKIDEVFVQPAIPAKILIVDDDIQVRSFLTKLLEIEGYQVIEACNGKEAQARCRQTAIEVITDLVMPEQEGLETIHDIRKHWPHIPVIAISGAFGGKYLEVAKKLGADAVFHKPFEPDSLLGEVRRRVGR